MSAIAKKTEDDRLKALRGEIPDEAIEIEEVPDGKNQQEVPVNSPVPGGLVWGALAWCVLFPQRADAHRATA